MARRIQPIPPAVTEELVLPIHLAAYVRDDWPTSRAYFTARADWFREHGIDPGDWTKVHPVLIATSRAHGLNSVSVDRARQQVLVEGTR